jgi:hypothetical protein
LPPCAIPDHSKYGPDGSLSPIDGSNHDRYQPSPRSSVSRSLSFEPIGFFIRMSGVTPLSTASICHSTARNVSSRMVLIRPVRRVCNWNPVAYAYGHSHSMTPSSYVVVMPIDCANQLLSFQFTPGNGASSYMVPGGPDRTSPAASFSVARPSAPDCPATTSPSLHCSIRSHRATVEVTVVWWDWSSAVG